MADKYQAYPEYKDSGADFLGDIPQEWTATRIKHVGLLKGGAGFPHDEQGNTNELLDFHKVNALGKATDEGCLTKSENTISIDTAKRLGAFVFPEESIVFAKVGAALLLARIRSIPTKACLDNNLMGLVVKKSNNPKFVKYAMNTIKFDFIVNPGAIPSLNEFQMGNMFLAMPPKHEQEMIANFLDHETAKIDTLIEEQQSLIRLLKEKRQAVISHAVTKGLNPDVPMKVSGVEWLGEVPEHWTLPKVAHLGRVLNGSTPDRTNLSYWTDGTVPWLASGCLNTEVVDEASAFITDLAYKNCSVELIPAHSLLIGMVGQGKTRGTSAILAMDSCINQNMAAIIPSKSVNISFLYFVFQTMYEDLRELGRGGNQAALNCEIISSIRIPFPPIDEQNLIADYLNIELEKLKKTDNLAVLQIEYLQERRTALISAAVTGKIDVRNWVEPAGHSALVSAHSENQPLSVEANI